MANRRAIGAGRRSDILFVGGIVGIVSEAVLHHDGLNLTLLAVYVGAAGLAPYLRGLDWLKRSQEEEEATGPSPPTSLSGRRSSDGP